MHCEAYTDRIADSILNHSGAGFKMLKGFHNLQLVD